MKRKVMISLSDEDLKAVDEYANSNHISRSAFVMIACRFYLQQDKALERSKDLMSLVDILLESNIPIDEDAKKKLEALKMFSPDLKSFTLPNSFDE